MIHRQTRFERSEEGSFPYWVCLIEEKCTGADYAKIQEFCQTNGLTISRKARAFGMQISRIRLSDKTSRLHPRHVVPKPAQAYEPEVPVEVREWIGPALASPDFVLDAQPASAGWRATQPAPQRPAR